MTRLEEKEELNKEEELVSLVDIYLELELSLQVATEAAAADLLDLDRCELVEEAGS
jgi:hypothetical protein